MGVNVTKQAKKAVNLISVGHFLRIKKKNYYNSQQAGHINLCVIYILRRIKVIAKKKKLKLDRRENYRIYGIINDKQQCSIF